MNLERMARMLGSLPKELGKLEECSGRKDQEGQVHSAALWHEEPTAQAQGVEWGKWLLFKSS